MLKVTSTLQSLSLEWNEIGNYEMAVAALAGALEVNQTLTYLGMATIAYVKSLYLQDPHVCIHVSVCGCGPDLRNNHISPDGASMLARSLRANNVLHTLVRIHILHGASNKLRYNQGFILIPLVSSTMYVDRAVSSRDGSKAQRLGGFDDGGGGCRICDGTTWETQGRRPFIRHWTLIRL